MLAFGVQGYFLKRYGTSRVSVTLSIIVGLYRHAMISAGENPGQFSAEFVTSPLSAIILAALAFTIAMQTAWRGRLRGR
jgi:putative tricarboxylic transport membrane protein